MPPSAPRSAPAPRHPGVPPRPRPGGARPPARGGVTRASLHDDGTTTCPYTILGVPPGASTADIKAAFRARAREHHPDVAPGCAAAASARFVRVSDAYALLTGRAHRRSGGGAPPRGEGGREAHASFDWYWSFVARATAKRKAAAAGVAPPPGTDRGPAPPDALASQLAGLRARAVRKAAAGGGRTGRRAAAGPAGEAEAGEAAASSHSPPPPAVDVTMSFYDLDGGPGDSCNAGPREQEEKEGGNTASTAPPRAPRTGAAPDTHRAQLAGLKRRAALRRAV